MSKWTSKDLKIIKLILDNLELNYTGGRSGHGRVYPAANTSKKIYGEEQSVNDNKGKSKDEEDKVKISRAFTEEDDE